MPRTERRSAERIYERQLPGGGFVAIEVTPIRSILGLKRYQGDVVVERRGERERRTGHLAPSVAHVSAATVATIFHELFPVAHSNVVLAAGCLAMQRRAAPVA
jgi:hypothetical protein